LVRRDPVRVEGARGARFRTARKGYAFGRESRIHGRTPGTTAGAASRGRHTDGNPMAWPARYLGGHAGGRGGLAGRGSGASGGAHEGDGHGGTHRARSTQTPRGTPAATPPRVSYPPQAGRAQGHARAASRQQQERRRQVESSVVGRHSPRVILRDGTGGMMGRTRAAARRGAARQLSCVHTLPRSRWRPRWCRVGGHRKEEGGVRPAAHTPRNAPECQARR
jgi:hypothetical protein